jgi:hypothetical protein
MQRRDSLSKLVSLGYFPTTPEDRLRGLPPLGCALPWVPVLGKRNRSFLRIGTPTV